MVNELNYKVESVEVRVVVNGFVVGVSSKSEERDKDGDYSYDSKEFVYETAEDAIEKVSDVLS